MGAICSAASLACCCTSAACSLCSCCPSCGNSVMTRIMYGIMLLVGAIAAAITLAPGLQSSLSKVPFCANTTSNTFVPADISVDCQRATGYLAVYRISFAFTCFFLLMSLIMIGVKSSRDPRGGIQNGFWGIKYLIVIGGCIGAFFIPAGTFGDVWMVFGLIGGFLFILIQLVLIVDFAHMWAEKWVRNFEENESKVWYVGLLLATFLNYAIAITGVVLLYIYFTHPDDCALNKFYISFNLILCVILSIISILPHVQEHQPRSGLLQSSVVSMYVIYLTWSSASNSPDTNCNPGFLLNHDPNQVQFDKESVIGLLIWLLVILYSTLRLSSNSERIISSDSENVIVESDNSNDKDDESSTVSYNWSFGHFIFGLAMLYIMMTLTNWYSPNSTLETLNSNSASMWVKIISSWFCIVIYIWTLVAPSIFPDRDFTI